MATNTYSGTFTVPATVKDSQQVLMRVRVQSGNTVSTMKSNNSLGTNTETEDYRVEFLSAVQVNPPTCATDTIPANGATGVSVNTSMLWDEVANASKYDVYFGTTNPPTTLVGNSQIANSYSPLVSLKPGTTYYWQVVPKNSGGSASGCAVWSFTTAGSSVNCTTNILPLNGATNVSITTPLQWNSIAEATSYDVYLGTVNPPTTIVSSSQAGTTFTPTGLLNNTSYYWKVIPKNSTGSASGCTVWSFVTIVAAPSCATGNLPADLTVNYSNLTPTLTWTAGSDATTWDVYFGTSATPPLVSSAQSTASYSPGTLATTTTYYWKVVPHNAGGSATGCSVWRFTTFTPCTAPVLTATANNVAGVYAVCPRITPTGISLNAAPTAGVGCTGTFQYSWSNGSKYWTGSAFTSTVPIYNATYTTISTTASDSTKYTVVVQCSATTTCTSQSSVLAIPLKAPASINAVIGTPANGLNHYMLVSWGKVNGASYELDYSTNRTVWNSTSFDGTATSFEYNTGDYPNDSTYFRVKAIVGSVNCDYQAMTAPKFTASDVPNLTFSNQRGVAMDFTLVDETPKPNPIWTTYSVTCQSCAPAQQYLQANGSLGSTLVYQTKAQWAVTKTITGLTPLTQYCFVATARNNDGDLRSQGQVCSNSGCVMPSLTSQTTGPITRCQGDTVKFKVNVASTSIPSYQWIKGGSADIAGATTSVLSLSNITLGNDANFYNCIITNTCGSISSNKVLLTINTPPVLNLVPLTVHKNIGDNFNLSVSPSGTGPFTYQWYLNSSKIAGATNGSYNVPSASTSDAGFYYCSVSNSCGKITSYVASLGVGPGSLLYGFVTYDNTASTPLTKTTVTITSSDKLITQSVTTDSIGHYVFQSVNNGKYDITGSTSKATGGINPADALAVNRYFVKLSHSFGDALKKKAADVDANNQINPVDALKINQRFVKLIKKFTPNNWVFNSDSIQVSSDMEHDFKGLCVGDVDGSFIPSLSRLMPDIYLINDGVLNIQGSKTIKLPFKITNDVELGSLGLILNFQASNIKIESLSSDIEGLIYNIADDQVSIAWSALNNGLNLKKNDVLFTLTLQTQSIASLQSSQLFTVDAQSLITDSYGNRLSGESISLPAFSNDKSGYYVISYPNPFTNITNIEYKIPQSGNVSIKVYNILGEEISNLVNAQQDAGTYKVTFDGSALPAGVYLYRIEAHGVNSDFIQSKLMMLSK